MIIVIIIIIIIIIISDNSLYVIKQIYAFMRIQYYNAQCESNDNSRIYLLKCLRTAEKQITGKH
jgi:hypothetical protein